ncbi:MAG: hypothetical protein RIS84_2013 [Pseudomonadota bacterium]|jgi:branched-chain amino acid transport system ATP-binding protein
MDKSFFALQEVESSYGRLPVLHKVSLEVNKGEIVTLIGANGAGKTSLLMTIFGNPRATQGHIYWQGKDIAHLPTHHIAGLGIALVPEGRRIFPAMTVAENLAMGGRNSLYASVDLEKILEMFPRLKERFKQRAGTLSGGEQQMLAIGRALMSRPQLLLLDEPSLGLAPLIVKQLFEILEEIANQGMTIFLVEQNANHALKLADRAYVLVNGRIELSGTGAELLDNPEVKRAYLGSL